jgi:hypothetical protein
MAASIASAVPWYLARYADRVLACDRELLYSAWRLEGALERFEHTCGEPGFRLDVLSLASAMRDHARLSESPDNRVRVVARAFEQADVGWLSDGLLTSYGSVRAYLDWLRWLDRYADFLGDLWRQYRSALASLLVLSSLRAGPYAGTVIIDLPNALGTVLRPFHRNLWDVRHWAGLRGHTTWITATNIPFLLVTSVASADLVLVLPKVVSGVRSTLAGRTSVAHKVGEVYASVFTHLAPIAAGWGAGILAASAGMAAVTAGAKTGAVAGGLLGSIPGVVVGAVVGGLAGLAAYYLVKWGTATLLEAGQVEDRLASGIEARFENAGHAALAVEEAVRSSVSQASAWIRGASRALMSGLSDGVDTAGRSYVALEAALRTTVRGVTESMRDGLESISVAGTRAVVAVTQWFERQRNAVDSLVHSTIDGVSRLVLTPAQYVPGVIEDEAGRIGPRDKNAPVDEQEPGLSDDFMIRLEDGTEVRIQDLKDRFRNDMEWRGAEIGPIDVYLDGDVTSEPGLRDPRLYDAVINQFGVATNGHYKGGDTYCNLFARDVMRAMGVAIPIFVDSDGNAIRKGDGTPEDKRSIAEKVDKDCRYTDVYHIRKWLTKGDGQQIFRRVSAQQAQDMANQGKPVIVLDTEGTHIAVVRPGEIDPERGPTIAQAGLENVNYGHVLDRFRAGQLEYYAAD